MNVIYYSITGNTKAFASRFRSALPVEVFISTEVPFVIFTPTYNFGEIPEPVADFLHKNHSYLKGVVAFGNRNWGGKFAKAGDLIAEQYGVPLIRKIELRGTDQDYDYINEVTKGLIR